MPDVQFYLNRALRQKKLHGVALCVLVFFLMAGLHTTFAKPMGLVTCRERVALPIEQSKEQILSTKDHGTIAYYRFGKGPPIVLITGFHASIEEWSGYFLQALAKNHEVIVFDNRGVGRSETPLSSYTINDLSDDALFLIHHLKLRDVTLLGWSMGGMIAQVVALKNKDHIDKLVLLSTTPPGDDGIATTPVVMDLLSSSNPKNKEQIFAALFTPTSVQSAEHCFVSNMFVPKDYKTRPISIKVVNQQREVIASWQKNEIANQFNIKNIAVSTLVLAGEKDGIVAIKNAYHLKRLIPHAKIKVFKQGGHALMYQYPVKLANSITN